MTRPSTPEDVADIRPLLQTAWWFGELVEVVGVPTRGVVPVRGCKYSVFGLPVIWSRVSVRSLTPLGGVAAKLLRMGQ